MERPVWSLKFKKYCKSKKYTAKIVSDKTGLAKATIDSYFQGKRKPTDENKQLLSEKIGLDIYDTFYNEDMNSEVKTDEGSA